ncbi:hypothetical protein D3C87_971950 [compost metagenome]
MGVGYNGGRGRSTDNQDILSDFPKRKYYKLNFINAQACTIKVNDSNPIPCPAQLGFSMDVNDAGVYSLVIVEPGIDFEWRGNF